MKQIIIGLALVLILATIGMFGFERGLSYIHIYIVAPLLLSILLVSIKAKRPVFNLTVSCAGLLSGVLALIPYYSVFTYAGGDGQVGLIFAVMPFYQLAFMFLVAAIAWSIMHLSKR